MTTTRQMLSAGDMTNISDYMPGHEFVSYPSADVSNFLTPESSSPSTPPLLGTIVSLSPSYQSAPSNALV